MIAENVRRLLRELPPGVRLLAVAKGHPPEAIAQAVAAGISLIGENYVQEAERARQTISGVAWHFIGHLQKNKVRKAAALFDMIETVDSREIAAELDRRCAELGKNMPVLIEVNSGREPQKSGAMPERVIETVTELARFKHLTVSGLMTMGPRLAQPAEYHTYFAETRRLFEHLCRLRLPGTDLRYLSMGMSDSYRAALAEGANIVRIGRLIFEDP